LVISLGAIFPLPKISSAVSVQPLKQIAYPPNGFLAGIFFNLPTVKEFDNNMTFLLLNPAVMPSFWKQGQVFYFSKKPILYVLNKPKKAKNKKIARKKTKRHIMRKKPKIINILFVCQKGVLRSPRNAEAFLEYLHSKHIRHRFHVSSSGNESPLSFTSKLLTADIVVAFSPAIASKARELVKGSNIRPDIIVFGKIGSSAAKTNYLKLAERALDKFGH